MACPLNNMLHPNLPGTPNLRACESTRTRYPARKALGLYSLLYLLYFFHPLFSVLIAESGRLRSPTHYIRSNTHSINEINQSEGRMDRKWIFLAHTPPEYLGVN